MDKLLSRIPIVVILGATGAGKSKLALEIASKFNGEIISTDAMQMYKGLDIVTNKVTATEQAKIPHHLINCLCPLESHFNVTDFKTLALSKISDIFDKQRLPVLVGGTNYYIEAILWQLLLEAPEKQKRSERSVTQEAVTEEVVATTDTLSRNEESKNVTCTSEGGCNQSELFRGELYNNSDTRALHEQLKLVDPESARRIHPHNKRKIMRALEVYEQHGVTMTTLLKQQHGESGASDVSGPLSFDRSCVIWVQCQQDKLNERTDRRVDQMLENGLLGELDEFHDSYNKQRLQENREADYTRGIFQSIGFKEFHQYLLLAPEERAAESGQKLLQQGIDDMKRATRKYSKKQKKWITGRFLKRRGLNTPAVYGVDSTDVSQWQRNVFEPASRIVQAFLNNESPAQEALPVEESRNLPEYNVCEICDGKVFVTTNQWTDHLNSKKHKANKARKRKLEAKLQQNEGETSLKQSKNTDEILNS